MIPGSIVSGGGDGFESFPQTKLREGNVFIGVCLSTGGISGPMSLL